MINTLPLGFVLRQIVEEEDIEKSGRLRVIAWNNILSNKIGTDSWLDQFEGAAQHWGIFENSVLVASARLTIHKSLSDLPDIDTWNVLANSLSRQRFGLISRLVIHPSYQGRGFSKILDEVRIEAAELAECRFVIAATADHQRRLPQLMRIGFFQLGEGGTIPIAESLGPPILLICPLPRFNNNQAIPTLNHYGWHGKTVNKISQQYIEYAITCSKPTLDVGAGLGVATLPALEAGATVIANDIELLHLLGLKAKVKPENLSKLQIRAGRFPNELKFPDESLSAIHLSNILHFLTGREISDGLKKLFDWLVSGGKIFITTATPYQQYMKDFIPIFQQRKMANNLWPGYIEDATIYYDLEAQSHAAPKLHVMDDEVLKRAVDRAGFVIELVEMYSRDGLPDFCKYDGREHVGLIARKP